MENLDSFEFWFIQWFTNLGLPILGENHCFFQCVRSNGNQISGENVRAFYMVKTRVNIIAGWPTPLKNGVKWVKVSWDDEFPTVYGKKMFETANQCEYPPTSYKPSSLPIINH
jgi:hypothetical protein